METAEDTMEEGGEAEMSYLRSSSSDGVAGWNSSI